MERAERYSLLYRRRTEDILEEFDTDPSEKK
jgi:hypothetical protein